MKENIMSKEAFNELIDGLEYVESLTEYGRKNIKYHVQKLQQENKILKENAENNDKVVDKVNWENMLLKKENKKLNGAIQTYDILLKSNIEENKQLKEELKGTIGIVEHNRRINEKNREIRQLKIQIFSEKKELCNRLESNWNKLKEFIVKEYYMYLPLEASTKSITILIDKMQELQGSDSNVKD